VRLVFEQDADYVAGFQQHVDFVCAMRKTGRSLDLLLAKARTELAIGSFQLTRDAAKSALDLDSHCAEAFWLHAKATLGLALVRLHVLNGGVGEGQHPDDSTPPEEYVEDARSSLKHCIRLSRGRDEEAVALLSFLTTVLAGRLHGRALARALAALPGA
jgi:hypothetical protein